MKIITKIFLTSIPLLLLSCNFSYSCKNKKIKLYQEQKSTHYELVWSDEFNYTGTPNTKKWDFEEGFVRNEELQWYQKENAYVDGNSLIITAKKETKPNPNYNPLSLDWTKNRKEAGYTSASLTTAKKFDFKYGKVDIRAKIDTKGNSWPAFWLLGSRNLYQSPPVPFPVLGEIDILEYYQNHIYANLFWEGKKGLNKSVEKYEIDRFIPPVDWSQYHIWTLIRTQDSIEIVLDYTYVLNKINISDIKNHHAKNNPFRENFYFILNLALRDKDGEITYPNENEDATFKVDYVRVYKQTK
ncbi:family 16 glycosylhydrolase [Neisseriaceae bacterium PsAf]|nr:family 16 glycosylhydrolase [Neisseriaceae bacterium PsAf]